MTNDDYTRMRFSLWLGHYKFFWRLMTFPLAACWRQHMLPVKADWHVCVGNPHEQTEELIAQQRHHLAEHPEDSMNRFTLGNVLRMVGSSMSKLLWLDTDIGCKRQKTC